ncbi:hypothetical protein ACFOOK_28095 [Micromonospora krabiensis]|uniref:Uncharacterized protein n=1 Tax=Micromonospora krabiensis TaxID=307121 RepID=A0A1C3N4R0_9ACTN|nr:hypothetical protein [Micromonospora krabiensis]SBV27569.1 hypothetical protein GA0070620_3093 [Micromonospora krabiensis]
MPEFVWMKHPGGTEAAPFAVDAVEFWQARGWEPVEKPAEPDPTAEPTKFVVPPHPDGPEAFVPRSGQADASRTPRASAKVKKS